MAGEQKTKSTPLDQQAWLTGVEESRRNEALRLLTIFAEATGWNARLWGASLVGFGRYQYRYASGHSGEYLATGFSPRKAELSIYIMPGYADFGTILARLGPHKLGKSCLYIKRLDKVDASVLKELIGVGLADLAKRWPVYPV